jgi:predicted MPP superfamily phosphohydrolase
VAILAALFIALIDAFLVEPYWIEVTRHEVGQGPDAITLLHLTDQHLSSRGRREGRVLEIVSEVKPDLIVITGDSVAPDYDPQELRAFLSELRAPLGVWACPGNWEEWTDGGAYEIYRAAGIRMLRDESATLLNGRLALVGLNTPEARRVISPAADFRLVLCHYPVVLPSAAQTQADLVLAGHTHGGQVRLPLWGAIWLPFDSGDYEAGWYAEGSTRMYVSRGVGTSIYPARFFCRPEVAVIRLRLPPQSG